MTISINNDSSVLFAQQALSTTQNTVAQTIAALSSGTNLNSQNNSVGLAISNDLISQLNGTNQTIQNLNDATNLLQYTDSSLSNIQNMLLNIKTLAVQAGDPTLSTTDKSSIVTQLQDLNKQISSTANQSVFNSTNLLATQGILDTTNSGLKVGTQLGNLDNTQVSAINVSSSAAQGVYTFTADSENGITLNQVDSAGNVLASQTVQSPNNVGNANATNFTLNFNQLGVSINLTTTPLGNAVGAVDNPSILASNLANIYQPIVVTSQNQNVSFGSGNNQNYLTIQAVNDTSNVESQSTITNSQLAQSSNSATLNATANSNATNGTNAITLTQTAQATKFTIGGFSSPTDTVTVKNDGNTDSGTWWLAIGNNVYWANGTTWKNATVSTSNNVTSVQANANTAITTGGPSLSGSVSITNFAKWIDNQNDALSVAVNSLSGGSTLEFASSKTGSANAVAFSNLGNITYGKNYSTGATLRGGLNLSATGRFGQGTTADQGGGWDYFAGQQTGNQTVTYNAGYSVWGDQTIQADGTASTGGTAGVVPAGYTYLISMYAGNIAQDAKGTINGRAFDSATNVFTDQTSGLNLYLNANIPAWQGPSSSSPVTVSANVTVTTGSNAPVVNGQMQALGNNIINTLGSVLQTGNESNWQQAVNQLSQQADSAINLVSSQRSTLGGQMNQVSYIVQNLNSQSTNLSNANSDLSDTNYAQATGDLTKNEIRQQAALSVLNTAATSFTSSVTALMKDWGSNSTF